MADRNLVLQLLITARDTASDVVDRVRTGLGGVAAAANAALEPLRSFGGLLAAAVGFGGAKQIVDLADAYTRLTNSIRVATTTEEEYQTALAAVIQVAKDSNADLDTTAQLYGKVASNAKALGLEQSQVADVTALVSKAMQLSGADTSAANGAILQFTQALSSGVLRGEEFNSVMEASPVMMEGLAKGLGVAVGELRAMAESGQLTADVVIQSLLSQKDAINEVYGKLPQTVAQGMQQLGNAATLFAGQLNEQTGATQTLGTGLKFLAQNLDTVTALIGAGLAVATARGVVAMTGYVQASLAASAAAKEQAIAQAAATAASIRDAEAKVAAAQGAYNVALATQRQTQAVLTLMQANLGYGTTEADVTAARIAAANAANAATAATQRYAAAQTALSGLQAESAAATGLFSRAMGFLTGPGGLILLAVSAFGLLYSAFAKQKPVTDDLTKSTDQYAEALKKMNTAQLTAELGRFSGAIEEQKRQVVAAQAEIEKYKTGHIGLYEALTESQSRAQLLTAAEGKQADAEARLALLQDNRTAVINRLADANQQAEDSTGGLTTAYRQQSVAMDKVATLYEQRAEYLKTIADAQKEETQALLDQATAAGDSNAIDRLTLQLAAQKADAAKEQAALIRAEAVAAQLKVDALEKVREIQGQLTPMEAGALQTARESAAAKDAEARAAEALAGKLQYQADHTLKLQTASLALLEVMAKEAEQADKNAAIKQVQIDASIELAKAKGDEAKAAALLAEKSAQTIKDGQNEIARNKERVSVLDQVINKLYAEAQLKGMTPEQQKYMQGLMDEANERKRTIATIEAKLPLMERERQQAEIMAGPIGELTRLYADQAKEHERAADASERYQNAQTQEAENALKLAQIKGDEQEIDRAQTALNEQKITQAQAIADARAVEATDAENALSAKALELAADGELSQADQKQLKDMEAAAAGKRDVANAAQQTVDQLGKEADATKRASEEHQKATSSADGLSAKLGQITQSARANMGALSEQAKVYFDMMTGVSAGQYGIISGFDRASEASSAFNAAMSDGEKEMVKFRSEITAANAAIKSADNSLSHSTGSLGVYLDSLAKASAQTTKAFYEQKLAAKELELSITGMAEKGTLTMSSLQIATRRAGNEFSLLDEEDLSGLTSALDEANQKLREMQQEAQDAQARLAELNAEIAAEKGDTATADRLKLELDQQQQIAEVEAQLAQARAQNNRELITLYEEQKQKLQELYDLKSRNLEKDIKSREEQERAAKTQTQTTASSSGGSGSGSSGGKTYNLNLNAGGKTLNAVTNTDPGAWLDELERARRGAA